MDMNEMMQQLANNPQMAAQLFQALQQAGMGQSNSQAQRPPMNWNVPTNPMAMAWYQNMMNAMNNMANNQNGQQTAQNQNQNQNSTSPTVSQTKNTKHSVSLARVVNSPDEIKPNEIPNDGSLSIFVNDDLNSIYVKRWLNDGSVDNLCFVQGMTQTQNNKNQPQVNNMNFDVEALMKQIANLIDGKLEEFKSNYLDKNRNQSRNSNNKKGGEVNGQ